MCAARPAASGTEAATATDASSGPWPGSGLGPGDGPGAAEHPASTRPTPTNQPPHTLGPRMRRTLAATTVPREPPAPGLGVPFLTVRVRHRSPARARRPPAVRAR